MRGACYYAPNSTVQGHAVSSASLIWGCALFFYNGPPIEGGVYLESGVFVVWDVCIGSPNFPMTSRNQTPLRTSIHRKTLTGLSVSIMLPGGWL